VFQLFDPRGPEEIGEDVYAPVYRFVLKAQDVPDQGDGEVRLAETMFTRPLKKRRRIFCIL